MPCESFRVDPTGRSVTCNMDESRLDVWVVDGLTDAWGSPGAPR
jgi:hypothetical protein